MTTSWKSIVSRSFANIDTDFDRDVWMTRLYNRVQSGSILPYWAKNKVSIQDAISYAYISWSKIVGYEEGKELSPSKIAVSMANAVTSDMAGTILDPCAGFGILLDAVNKRFGVCESYGIEEDRYMAKIGRLTGANIITGSSLCAMWRYPDPTGIIMFPPFYEHPTGGNMCGVFVRRMRTFDVPIVALLPSMWVRKNEKKIPFIIQYEEKIRNAVKPFSRKQFSICLLYPS